MADQGQVKSSGEVYARTARVLHWATAVGVAALIPLGLAMTRLDLGLAATVALYQLHKAIGICVGALMLIRLCWRIAHAPPPWPAAIPAWRRRAATLAHTALYALLLLLPLSGWLMVSAAPIPFPTTVFGLFDVPHLPLLAGLPYEQRLPWSERLTWGHRVLAWTAATLIGGHIAGALLPSAHKQALRGRMSLWSRRSRDEV
jgi:cytochrome b561